MRSIRTVAAPMYVDGQGEYVCEGKAINAMAGYFSEVTDAYNSYPVGREKDIPKEDK